VEIRVLSRAPKLLNVRKYSQIKATVTSGLFCFWAAARNRDCLRNRANEKRPNPNSFAIFVRHIGAQADAHGAAEKPPR